MNKKAQRINHEKLENLFSNPHGIGLVHDYSGTSTLFNKNFPESLVMDDDFTKVMANEQKQRKASTARPPRPRFVITYKKSFHRSDLFIPLTNVSLQTFIAIFFYTTLKSLKNV